MSQLQRKPGRRAHGLRQRGACLCRHAGHDKAARHGLDKVKVVAEKGPNIGIVTAYNDMLSAHAPLQPYPDLIKGEARQHGATAQVAGGVPAMCDGVTQGTTGMELSLFSRDVIAMATAVSLSHDVFDAALMLGVCDKIVPGLLIGALHFGHLPTVFVPAGPMTSGLSEQRKSQVREQAAQGLVGRDELLRGRAQRPTTAPAPAPFTARPTATRCCSKPWACMCPARPSSTRAATCATNSRAKRCAPCWASSSRRSGSRRSAAWSMSAPSSTPWWRCWPPAARPTT